MMLKRVVATGIAADGSYDHCVNVRVLGFGGWQCNRVGA